MSLFSNMLSSSTRDNVGMQRLVGDGSCFDSVGEVILLFVSCNIDAAILLSCKMETGRVMSNATFIMADNCQVVTVIVWLVMYLIYLALLFT